MHEHIVLALAGIGILALVCQWVAWWIKLPAILFLLLAGLAAGPATGLLDPDALFGDLLFPIVSLSVAVILFEGSLTLKLEQIRGLEAVVRRLVTVGTGVTWAVSAVAAHWLVGFSWELAVLFGAVTVVTGPTVIVPMLRSVRPNARVANILRWEGIVIDPLGALLAVLVFEFIISGQSATAFEHGALVFAQILGTGVIAGVAAGYALGLVLRRHLLPEFLHNVATLTLVFGVFALSNALYAESGLLAVTVMGFWLANMRDVPLDNIIDFKESLSVLLISGLFIILAARVEFAEIRTLGWGALGVLAAIQFIARPLKALVSTWGSSLEWRERALVAWIAPRGIVAAAVAAVFSIRLSEHGFQQATFLVPLTFLVILGTVIVQSATAGLLARWLGVAEPEPKGFLIVGANPVARAIAKALDDSGFPSLVSDTNWEYIRAARMEGLSTYYGNVVSEHADRHLDLVGIGRMLALSPRRELNALAATRYQGEFGANGIFAVQTSTEKQEPEKTRVPTPQRGQVAFDEDVTYKKLSSLLSQGGEIHDTHLTEAFEFQDYQARYGRKAVPLFAIDPKQRLHVFTPTSHFVPGDGWVVVGLIQPDMEQTADAGASKGSGASQGSAGGSRDTAEL